MTGKKEKITPEENCKHKFVKYPPKVGRLKVCEKCGFLWVLGDVKFGEHSIKLSGSGNYIEASTTTARNITIDVNSRQIMAAQPIPPNSSVIIALSTVMGSAQLIRGGQDTGTDCDYIISGIVYS